MPQTESHRLQEQTYGSWWGRDSQKASDGHAHNTIFKMDNQQ